MYAGETYNVNKYIQPIKPVMEGNNDQAFADQWEPMIEPQQSRNRKVWKTYSGGETVEQQRESADNKGEQSQENVEKRWPLIKDNIESEIFRDDWKTEKSPLLGLTQREPDWTSEDPFSRIDRSAPQISTPIYHRDVEEVRTERKTAHGYDKSVSRTSKISWDDKEEYLTTDKESLVDNSGNHNHDAGDQGSAPFQATRIETPSSPPVTNQPEVSTNARVALGLNKPAKKYVWFDMPSKKAARSSRVELTPTTTTPSPREAISEIQTQPPNYEPALLPAKIRSENKKQTRSSKQTKAKSRSKSVWGLRRGVASENPRTAAIQSTAPTVTTFPTTTRGSVWNEFETSTKVGDDLNREWESISRKNNLRKRKGFTDEADNQEAAVTTTIAPTFFESLPTNGSRATRSRRKKVSASVPNEGSFSYETSIDHGSAEVEADRSSNLRTKGGSNGSSGKKKSPARTGFARRRSSVAPRKVNLASEDQQQQPKRRREKLVATDIPFETTTTIPFTTNSPTRQPSTTVITTFKPDFEEIPVSTVNSVANDNGMEKAALIQADRTNAGGRVEEEEPTGRLEDVLPGVPDQDYATFKTVPKTAFRCSDHQWPGYYGDVEAKCQVFHICQTGGRQDDFICPIGTVFNQMLLVCDWWNNFRCEDTPSYYELNANIYDYSKDGTNNQGGSRFGDKMAKDEKEKSGKLVVEDNDDSSAGDLPSTSSVYFDEDYRDKAGGEKASSAGLEKEANDYGTKSSYTAKRDSNKKAKFDREPSDDVEYYFEDNNSTPSSTSRTDDSTSSDL